MNLIWYGFIGSLLAGLGASGIFLVRRLSERTEDILLSSAAGVMLAATFSLLLPGIGYGEDLYASRGIAVVTVIGGLLAGAAALYGVHRYVPHEHFFAGREGRPSPGWWNRWAGSSEAPPSR